MKKKLLLFMFMLLPVLGNAQTLIDGIYYNLNSSDNTASVTNNSNSFYSGSVVIPERVSYEGTTYSVTCIGNDAFNNCTNLTSVSIPNSVTSIESSAFGTTNLRTLIVGTGVQRFSGQSFSGATRPIKTIWLTNTPPENYSVAEGIVNYVANGQYGSLNNRIEYKYLSSIFNVDGVTFVPVSPSERTCDAIDFIYDESKTKVNINTSVNYQGVDMRVMNVQPYIFYQNPYLQKVNLDVSGRLSQYALSNCQNLQEVLLGNYVTNIDDYAFSGCQKLENIIIPDAVKAIGQYAFFGCSDMTSVHIGNGASTIGKYAFSGCSGITSVYIGNGTSTIEQYAFSGCSDMTSVHIGNGARTIEQYAFSDCSSLTSINIGDSLKIIEQYAFLGCSSLPSVTIPGSVLYIGDYAFSGCNNLKEVFMEERKEEIRTTFLSDIETKNNGIVLSIPVYADYEVSFNYELVGELNFGEGGARSGFDAVNGSYKKKFKKAEIFTVTFVRGKYPYSDYYCHLTNIKITEGNILELSSEQDPLFKDCPLNSVFIDRSIAYSRSPFSNNTSLCSATIADNVTEIMPNEFEGCTNLKNVEIGSSVKKIGDRAFSSCSNLNVFTIGASIDSIGIGAFSGCTTLTQLISHATTPPICGGQALDDINKWTCKLFIPKGCMGAYQTTDQWKEFFFIEERGYYPIVNGIRYSIISDKDARVVALENGEKYSGDIVIPKSITVIGHDLRISSIDQYAFQDCKDLISVSIPDGVTSIGEKAFYGCSSLVSVITLPEIPPYLENNSFSDYSAQLIVPKGCKEAYQQAQGWSQFKDITDVRKYKLTYMVDGDEYKSYEIEAGTSITRGPVPTKEGYIFLGWSEIPTTMPAHDVVITGTFTNLAAQGITGTNYLLNAESGLFMTAANDWGTRASVNETGITFVIEGNEESGYTLDSRVYEKDIYRYLNLTEDDKIYCDKTACNWFFKEVSGGIYALTKDNQKYIAYDGSSSVLTLSDNANDPKSQWRIVTEEMRKAELSKATEAAPLNATFLLPDANFSRFNQQGNWQGNPKKDGDDTNMNGAKSNTNFDVYQVITGVPNGYYVAKMQGFYREGTDAMHLNGTEHLYAQFYVNEESMPVKSIFDEAGNIPDNQISASSSFNAGMYEHNLTVHVTNGTLRIGVRKQTTVYGDWTCFDNFRLIYYGNNLKDELIVTADDKTMAYGDNVPALTYTSDGGRLNGKPKLSTTATKTSPVGTYPVKVEKGTVTNMHVTYVDGTLTVTKVPLTITAKSDTIRQGDPLPSFKAEYQGFKNNEREAVLTKLPTLSCEANEESTPGEYEITVNGAEAQNYEIQYVAGKLTVIEPNSYYLTYMVDGEVFRTFIIKYGEAIAPLANPDKEGYSFSGWSEIPATMPAHDVVITGLFIKIAPQVITGTNYLQNVESGLFMTAANDWGTRASVDETGITFVIKGNEESGYTLDTRVYENDTYRYLNLTEDDKIYCDKTACNWFFKEISDGIYGLTKDNQKYIAYDGSSSVLTLSENANDPKSQWWIVTEEMRKAVLNKATEAAPLNATFLLPDANFSRFNQQGNWQGNPKKDGENTNTNGEKYDTNFDVYQEITGVPNGFYVVKMQGFYREGTDANQKLVEMHQNGTEHLYAQFYVNEESMPVMSIFDEAGKNGTVGKSTGLGYIPNSQAHASSYFDRGLYEHELKVAVEDGTLRIGVRKQTDVSNDWTCFDNFRLIYYGTNAPFVGIEQIDSEQGTTDNAPKSIYDLSGRKLQNLQRGVNILRMNDGTTRKVLKK